MHILIDKYSHNLILTRQHLYSTSSNSDINYATLLQFLRRILQLEPSEHQTSLISIPFINPAPILMTSLYRIIII